LSQKAKFAQHTYLLPGAEHISNLVKLLFIVKR